MKIKLSALTLAVMFLLNLQGCAPTRPQREARPARSALSSEVGKYYQPLKINAVYVYPLEAQSAGQGAPLEMLNLELMRALDSRTSLDLVNHSADNAKLAAVNAARRAAASLRKRAAAAGQALDAQGVLYGVVTRYRHGSKSGGGYASLAFRLWLIEPATGDTLWTASFEKTEESLSENVLNIGDAFKKGFRFRSVEELAQLGFTQAAEELERLRESSRK